MPDGNATVLFSRQALLPNGWAKDVCITLGTDGRISSVETGVDPTASRGAIVRTGPLLPAPVNLHSHAFQRAMAGMSERRGSEPTDSFWTWRQIMFRFLDALTPEDIEAITALVQVEMLEAGYAAVGEFHYLHHQPGGAPYDNFAELSERVMSAALETGIGLTLLPVFYQYGGCDKRPLSAGQIRFGNTLDAFCKLHEATTDAAKRMPDDTMVGVAPHSLRAADTAGLSGCVALAGDAPLHMHLAEQVAEVDEVSAALGTRPVEWLLANQNVAPNWCLIHCTQMTAAETTALARTGAVAGLCPITESSLGDGIFNGVQYLSDGGTLGIGSDSNIRISLSEELRTLEYSQRLRDLCRASVATPEKSTGRVLFEEAVKGGAQAAGRPSGGIAEGQTADLVALDETALNLEGRKADEVLDAYIFTGDDRMVSEVWSAGRHVVTKGIHVKGGPIRERFRKTMASLAERI